MCFQKCSSITQSEKMDSLHLDCSGVDMEAKATFANYNKIDFVKSVSKTGFG